MEVKELVKKIEDSITLNNLSLMDGILQLYRDNVIDRKLFRGYLGIDEAKFQAALDERKQEDSQEYYEDELFFRMYNIPIADRRKYYENFRRHFNE